jgi:hypothetical protein
MLEIELLSCSVFMLYCVRTACWVIASSSHELQAGYRCREAWRTTEQQGCNLAPKRAQIHVYVTMVSAPVLLDLRKPVVSLYTACSGEQAAAA